MIKIPIIDAADQQMGLILNNRRVTLRLRFNNVSGRWSFDLSIDDTVVLRAQRILPGVDLLGPFGFDLGMLFVITEKPGDAVDRRAFVEERAGLIHMTTGEYEVLSTLSVDETV